MNVGTVHEQSFSGPSPYACSAPRHRILLRNAAPRLVHRQRIWRPTRHVVWVKSDNQSAKGR